MIKRGRLTLRSYMTMRHEFSGVCISDLSLTPSKWQIEVDMGACTHADPTEEELESVGDAAASAYQRILFWLSVNLDNVVLVDVNNASDYRMAMFVDNPVVFMPGNSMGDDLLVKMLHSKLTALAGDSLIVGSLRITSSHCSLGYTFDIDSAGYMLPECVSDYFTEYKTAHTQPWWMRNDGFCLEIPVDDNGNIDPDIKDPLAQFETRDSQPEKPARVLRVDSWAPKKV